MGGVCTLHPLGLRKIFCFHNQIYQVQSFYEVERHHCPDCGLDLLILDYTVIPFTEDTERVIRSLDLRPIIPWR